MNRLTAIRSFGNPGYTPAKKVRLFNDRYYMLTMQNTETDQGDGHYLVEGTYTIILPGDKARGERDSHLNHCNGITEYTGPIWQLGNNTCPFYCQSDSDQLFSSKQAALSFFAKTMLDEYRRHEHYRKQYEKVLAISVEALYAQELERYPLATEETIKRNVTAKVEVASEALSYFVKQEEVQPVVKRIR